MMIFLLGLYYFFSLKFYLICSNYFLLDMDKSFMLVLIPFVLFLVLYMDKFDHIFNFTKDQFFYNLSFFAVNFFFCLCVLCSSNMIFLMSMELTLIPMLYLMLNFSKDSDKVQSTMSMVFFNVFASVPFMAFNFFLSPNMSLSYFNSSFNFFLVDDLMLILFCSLVMMLKLPVFLAHFWLTKAHVSAFGSCSMILAGIMLKLGSFGLLKYYDLFLFDHSILLLFIFTFSFCSILYMNMLMIRFFDIKFLVACSSVVHMGLILPLLMHYCALSVISSLFMMVGHGFVSYYLFYLVSLMYDSCKNRSFEFNKSYTTLCFVLSMIIFLILFLNIGIPPFSGFFCELMFCSFFYNFCSLFMYFFLLTMVLFMTFNIFLACKIFFGKTLFFFFNSGSFFFLSFYFFISSYFIHMYFYL